MLLLVVVEWAGRRLGVVACLQGFGVSGWACQWDRSDSRLTFQDWGGKRERKGRGKGAGYAQLEKGWLLLPGAGRFWTANLPKSLGCLCCPMMMGIAHGIGYAG